MIFFHGEARNCMFHYLVSHDEKCTAWAARLAHGVDYHAQLTHHRIVPARVGWWDALEREHREARGWKHGAARSGGSPVILSDGHEWNSHTKRNLDGLTKWKQFFKKEFSSIVKTKMDKSLLLFHFAVYSLLLPVVSIVAMYWVIVLSAL